jgi:hypothetical protein
MKLLTFERRDKWCYGIAMVALLTAIVLLFSDHVKIGNSLVTIAIAFVVSYAFGRGHASAFSRRKDSDEEDDNVA